MTWPIDWSDSNQVLAWATLALAIVAALAFIANAVIAVFTLKAARATGRSASATETAAKATKDAAEATRDEAEATREEAAASRASVDELRLDREQRQRPFLRWTVGGGAWVEGSNVGGGPALNAVFCVVQPGHWQMSAVVDVSPNQTMQHQNVMGEMSVQLPDQSVEAIPGNEVTTGAGMVALCEDSAGNRYRFRDRHVIPDIWRADTAQKPGWVAWYEHQVGYA